MIIGIDASRNRSGGAIAHIRGLLGSGVPERYGISHVHLWAHEQLLNAVITQPWLVKHTVPVARQSILHQLIWQSWHLPKIARSLGVDVMFNTDAGSLCLFQPSVTLSQDMLSFEPGEMQRYPWGTRARLRLELLRVFQLHRLRRSSVAAFLSDHARDVIGALTLLSRSTVIPHGIDEKFLDVFQYRTARPLDRMIRCLYVSNAAPYKHQWHVVEAVAKVRDKENHELCLRLVGGGNGPAFDRLNQSIASHDPDKDFVEIIDFVHNDMIVQELMNADIFIYASSCENMPITLLEAMAAGLPIVCSNRGPMPEILEDAGVYFDPEHPDSIAQSIETIITNNDLRSYISRRAHEIAVKYTWDRCADKTFSLLRDVALENIHDT